MHRLRSLGRGGRLLLVVAVGGAVFGIASAVQASIPDASGVIHGCYNTSLAHGSPTGALRVIDTAKPNGTCASWEAPLDWNQTGPTGVTGATGPTGPTGPSGSWYAEGHASSGANDAPTTIASLTLPPGNYTLSAAGGSIATLPGNTNVRCTLRNFGDADEDAFYAVDSATVVQEEFAIDINVALPAGGTVNLRCRNAGAAGTTFTGGHIQATAVQTLHSVAPAPPLTAPSSKPGDTRTQ